jgi:hypothetical protein
MTGKCIFGVGDVNFSVVHGSGLPFCFASHALESAGKSSALGTKWSATARAVRCTMIPLVACREVWVSLVQASCQRLTLHGSGPP